MKFRWDNRYLHLGVTAFLVIAASMLFYYGIFHMKTLVTGLKTLSGIMAPIIYGVAIAFLLSPIVNFMEKKLIFPFLEKKELVLEKRGRRVVRWICVLIALFLFIFSIYALIMMILPQLIRSIMNLIYSFPHYVNVVQEWLQAIMEKGWDLNDNTIQMVEEYSTQAQDYLTTTILPQMQDFLKDISAGLFDVIIFLKNFIIGAIVSLYLLADKEGFIAKGKMAVYAFLPTKQANFIIHAMRFTSRTFIGFISGQILDSAIIGVLCYIGASLLNMPYAILISVLIGVTNVIPFFGPYLGAVPSVFLILLVDPMKALYFALFILALQQFDGNILCPKILGGSTGLSSFMVIVAILVGGGLFGIPGMVIGVPVFAVAYAALQKTIRMILQQKKIPDAEEDYLNIDCLDTKTKERILFPEDPAEKEPKEQKRTRTALVGFLMTLWKTVKKLTSVAIHYLKEFSIRAIKWSRIKLAECRDKLQKASVRLMDWSQKKLAEYKARKDQKRKENK